MKPLKKLCEELKKMVEDASKANERMWKGQKPSCCNRDDRRLKDAKH